MSNPYIPAQRFDKSQSAKSKSMVNETKDDRLERKDTAINIFKDMKILPETPREGDSREDSYNDSKGSQYNRAQINEDIIDLIKQERKTSNFKDKRI